MSQHLGHDERIRLSRWHTGHAADGAADEVELFIEAVEDALRSHAALPHPGTAVRRP